MEKCTYCGLMADVCVQSPTKRHVSEQENGHWDFGQQIIDEFLQRARTAFPAYCYEDLRSRGFRPLWTGIIKGILSGMARERSLVSRCCPDNRDLLLDLVWMDASTKKCELAVESELGITTEVAEDLEKLLYVKSRVRLMICDPWPDTHLENTIGTVLRGYGDHRSGDHYLVLNLRCNPDMENRPSTCSPLLYEARITEDVDIRKTEPPPFPLART